LALTDVVPGERSALRTELQQAIARLNQAAEGYLYAPPEPERRRQRWWLPWRHTAQWPKATPSGYDLFEKRPILMAGHA